MSPCSPVVAHLRAGEISDSAVWPVFQKTNTTWGHGSTVGEGDFNFDQPGSCRTSIHGTDGRHNLWLCDIDEKKTTERGLRHDCRRDEDRLTIGAVTERVRDAAGSIVSQQ